MINITEYKPYKKALERYEKLKEQYDKDTSKDNENAILEAQNVIDSLIEAQAECLISEPYDNKQMVALKKQAIEAEKRLITAKTEYEQAKHDRKIIESGLAKLKQEVESKKAEAIEYISAEVKAEHGKLMQDALKATRELSIIFDKDKALRDSLMKNDIKIALANIPQKMNPGTEDNRYGTLFLFVQELKKRGYKV